VTWCVRVQRTRSGGAGVKAFNKEKNAQKKKEEPPAVKPIDVTRK